MIVICVPLASSETISGVITGEMQCGYRCHSYGKCYISATQIRHDIGGYTTRTTAYKDQTKCDSIRKLQRTFVSANARNGMIRYCAIAPIQISKGLCARILKSSVVSVSPMLNMMIPMMID